LAAKKTIEKYRDQNRVLTLCRIFKFLSQLRPDATFGSVAAPEGTATSRPEKLCVIRRSEDLMAHGAIWKRQPKRLLLR
jgi:hypothetical protein